MNEFIILRNHKKKLVVMIKRIQKIFCSTKALDKRSEMISYVCFQKIMIQLSYSYWFISFPMSSKLRQFCQMLILLLLVAVAPNPCPYCKWDACQLTEGSFPNCTACYDIAALVPIYAPATHTTPRQSYSVCQLCPEHCYSCQYVLLTPTHSTPVPAINCTSCEQRYVNSYFDGTCRPCPSNCLECGCVFNSCSMTVCHTCDPGYTLVNSSVCVLSNSRRLQKTEEVNRQGQGVTDQNEEYLLTGLIVSLLSLLAIIFVRALRKKMWTSVEAIANVEITIDSGRQGQQVS